MNSLESVENSTVLQHTQRGICIATLIHNFGCLASFSYNIFISNRNRPTLRIEWLSFFSLLTIVIFSASLLCILYPFGADSISCVYITIFSSISFSFSKFSLYSFFLERLHIINIQNLNIKIWRSALCIWAAFISASFIIFGRNAYYDYGQQVCVIRIRKPPFVLATVLLGDIVISVSISTMLCRALLIVIYKNCEQAKNEYVLLNLLKKFALLSAIAVVSTQFSLIIGVVISRTLGSLFTSMDSVVNVWCILLSFGHNDKMNKVYDNICGRCHGCFGWKECLLCFACNCCCSVSNDQNQKTEKEETKHSTTTGVTTTMDHTVTTVKPGVVTITQMEASNVPNDSKSFQLCIQSTIELSIKNDGSTNVKTINVETNVETK